MRDLSLSPNVPLKYKDLCTWRYDIILISWSGSVPETVWEMLDYWH